MLNYLGHMLYKHNVYTVYCAQCELSQLCPTAVIADSSLSTPLDYNPPDHDHITTLVSISVSPQHCSIIQITSLITQKHWAAVPNSSETWLFTYFKEVASYLGSRLTFFFCKASVLNKIYPLASQFYRLIEYLFFEKS